MPHTATDMTATQAHTVISILDRHHLTPLCAIPGRHEPAGQRDADRALHVTTVTAVDAEQAMRAVRDAARLIGAPLPQDDRFEGGAVGQWTAIGLVDTGLLPSWRLIAVVPGAVQVQGRWESMLSHRWATVVGAADAQEARDAAYRWAYQTYTCDED